jgi:hypothetical protein
MTNAKIGFVAKTHPLVRTAHFDPESSQGQVV